MRKLALAMIVAAFLTAAAGEVSAQKGKWAKGQTGTRSEKVKEKLQNRKLNRDEITAQRKQKLKEEAAAKKQNKEEAQAARKERLQALKEKWEAMRQHHVGVQNLHERIKAFQEAKKAGDPELLKQRKTELQQQWQDLSPEEKQTIHQQIPELIHRLRGMQGANAAGGVSGTVTGPRGKQAGFESQTTVNGNGATFEREITGQDGKKVKVSGSHVREGNTVVTDKTYTGPAGKEATLTETAVVNPPAAPVDTPQDILGDFLAETDL